MARKDISGQNNKRDEAHRNNKKSPKGVEETACIHSEKEENIYVGGQSSLVGN